jgi:hypothetical protein
MILCSPDHFLNAEAQRYRDAKRKTEPYDLIKDPQRTPFNIGTRIDLTDFTLAEAQPLAAGLAADDELASRLLQEVFAWTDGHPYLTQKLCRQIAQQAATDTLDTLAVTPFVQQQVHALLERCGTQHG